MWPFALSRRATRATAVSKPLHTWPRGHSHLEPKVHTFAKLAFSRRGRSRKLNSSDKRRGAPHSQWSQRPTAHATPAGGAVVPGGGAHEVQLRWAASEGLAVSSKLSYCTAGGKLAEQNVPKREVSHPPPCSVPDGVTQMLVSTRTSRGPKQPRRCRRSSASYWAQLAIPCLARLRSNGPQGRAVPQHCPGGLTSPHRWDR